MKEKESLKQQHAQQVQDLQETIQLYVNRLEEKYQSIADKEKIIEKIIAEKETDNVQIDSHSC